MEAPLLAEAVIRGGTEAGTDVDEAAAGYLHLKHNTSLVFSRKIYFQFDVSGAAADTNAPATLHLAFVSTYQQRVQLWALSQAYPGFNSSITWNNAQANDTSSNDLLQTGPLTAVKIGPSAFIPITGTTPYSFTIPRLSDVMVSNRVTLVLTGVDDPANNQSGLRVTRMAASLSVALLEGFQPPALSSVPSQTIFTSQETSPLPFTLADEKDDAASLQPVGISSNTNVIPAENISFGGAGSNRTVTVRAGAQVGAANITIRVTDSDGQTGSASFQVTVVTPPIVAAHYDVYFASGQSNMDGRGSTNDLIGPLASWNAPQADVRIYYANPINLDWANPSYDTGWRVFGPGFSVPPGFAGALPSTRFGPELAFGRSVADATVGRAVAIIKVSQGGTTLSSDWNPATGYMYRTLTNTARLALQSLTNDGTAFTLRGMIWHQGESDGSSSTATYQARLTEFIAAVRRDFGVGNLPFVVGELATNRSLTVRQAQFNVAQTVPYVGFASSSNLVTLAPDDPHFNSEGALLMGQRMAGALEVPPVLLLNIRKENEILRVTGSGLARSRCRLVSSANLSLPFEQWTTVSSNIFDSDGNVTFTHPIAPDSDRAFYAIAGD